MYSISAIGQDSHRFEEFPTGKLLLLAGVEIESELGLEGNSDADLLWHVICNAISGLTCEPVLGPRADALCRNGIKSSVAYIDLALQDLKSLRPDLKLQHLSLSVECKKPKLIPYFDKIRAAIADKLALPLRSVAITATTGEGLTGMGRGEGMAATCVLTALCDDSLN